MEIVFSKNKNCDAFKELMENQTDRQAQKKFRKNFNDTILGASIKVYQKLKSSDNAFVFNLASSANNKIEIASGVKKNKPLVLKIRIQGDYRKFFHFDQSATADTEDFCLVQNWTGQFKEICKINVFDVNKHDYSVL